jgi:hypothetical protein
MHHNMASRITAARASCLRLAHTSRSRCFSVSSSVATSTVNVESVHNGLLKMQSDIATGLANRGFYSTILEESVLSADQIRDMRRQAMQLRQEGRFEPSWSESIDPVSGVVTRFDKEGVFACEPDGADYDTAPDLLHYMTAIIQYLPLALNESYNNSNDSDNDSDNYSDTPLDLQLQLSNKAFNAKLAVTSPGGSVYPLHVDNAQGLQANDVRKLTVILYLNPDYNNQKHEHKSNKHAGGGELRLYLTPDCSDNGGDDGEKVVQLDLPPDGGRVVFFWSDEIPHEVLPTAPTKDPNDETFDRYALTIWLPTDNVRNIHNSNSNFKSLRERVKF